MKSNFQRRVRKVWFVYRIKKAEKERKKKEAEALALKSNRGRRPPPKKVEPKPPATPVAQTLKADVKTDKKFLGITVNKESSNDLIKLVSDSK